MSIRPHILISLVLVLILLALYGQVGGHEFISFDDDVYVTQNPDVQEGLTLKGIQWSLATTYAKNWHPLAWVSHMVDVQLYGMTAGRHHLTNVLFHIMNTLLLFLVFRRMTGDLWRSSFVAALFALHPLNVESVAWVSERKNVLSTFFWILTMWGYLWYTERPTVGRYFLPLFLFVLGLAAKPMLVSLPFVLLLLDYWPLRRCGFVRSVSHGSGRAQLSAGFLIWEKLPFFVVSTASGILTLLIQHSAGAVGSFHAYPVHVRVANAVVSYTAYIGKMFYPHNLSVFYPHQGIPPWWQLLASLAVLGLGSLVALKIAASRPWFMVGWLWYLGTLLPVIGLIQVGGQAMADRYTYVPLIGLFIMIAWGVPELVSGWRHRKAGIAAISAAFLAILTITTWAQIRFWTDSISLFAHALSVTEDNYVAHNNLGNALKAADRPSEAVEHYLKALEIKPGYALAHNNLGLVLANQGRIAEAINHYSAALQSDCELDMAHNNMGVALARQGRTAEALKHYAEALRINPLYWEAHVNMGAALEEQKKPDQAMSHYLEALRINPKDGASHNNIGVILARRGDLGLALGYFGRALRLNPDCQAARDNLKKALAVQRRNK